ncbi:hypothetical protein MTO96_040842 [Rhipicephalus appendiculatus]
MWGRCSLNGMDQAEVVQQVRQDNYIVKFPEGTEKWVHANHLRKYYVRVHNTAVVFETDEEFGQLETVPQPRGADNEINNNPLQSGSKAKTPVSATKPWPRIVPLDHTASYSDRRTQPRTEEGNVVPDSGGGGRGADNDGERDDRVRLPLAEGTTEEDGSELTLCGGDETSTTSGHGYTCSATARDVSLTDPFSGVFSDLSDYDT